MMQGIPGLAPLLRDLPPAARSIRAARRRWVGAASSGRHCGNWAGRTRARAALSSCVNCHDVATP